MRKVLWAKSILKNTVKFMREYKDNEIQAFIHQAESIVRRDKNIPDDQKEEMIAYRAFRAIYRDQNVREWFFKLLETEKGISLTLEELREIDTTMRAFYLRNSTSVFQGIAAQMFCFDLNEQNFEMIHSMLNDLNRGNISAALEKNISMSFDNVEFLNLKGEFDNIVEKAKKLESKPEGKEEVLGVLQEGLLNKHSRSVRKD